MKLSTQHVSDGSDVVPRFALVHFTKNRVAGGLGDQTPSLLVFSFK
jgi:hypothetical protein